MVQCLGLGAQIQSLVEELRAHRPHGMDKRIKNKSSLCISDNSPLSNMPFANIFSQSVVCFILLTLSFTEQKFLILKKSNFSIISFMNQAFGGVSKKASPCPRSPALSTLSSRSFYIWSMIHFELAFFFFFWHVDVQLFHCNLLKRLLLFHCIAFTPLAEIS